MMNQGCQKCGTLARSRLNLFSYIDFTNTPSELLIYGEGKWQCEEWDVWISLHFYHLGVKCSIACTQYDFGNPFIAKVIRSNRLYMKFEIPVQPTQSEIKSTSKTIQLFTSIQYHMRWKISRIFYSFICNNVSVLGAKMRKVSFEIVYILVIQFNICVRNEFFHIHVYFYLFRFTIFASPSSFFWWFAYHSIMPTHINSCLMNSVCMCVFALLRVDQFISTVSPLKSFLIFPQHSNQGEDCNWKPCFSPFISLPSVLNSEYWRFAENLAKCEHLSLSLLQPSWLSGRFLWDSRIIFSVFSWILSLIRIFHSAK